MMPPLIGFVVLSHNKPLQLRRLADRLARMFPDAPIVCHHDFSQCAIDPADVPDGVAFVDPHVRTSWGDFSLVEAAIRGLRVMHSRADAPEWVFLLSGSDYPIKPAREIRRVLQNSPYDAYVRHELIRSDVLSRSWLRKCNYRYRTLRVRLPVPSGMTSVRWKDYEFHGSWTRHFLPFSRRFECYAGSQWFTANRRAVRYLLSQHRRRPLLAAHYRINSFADESYVQTILANAGHLRIHNSHLRYIDFPEEDVHPRLLTSEDLPTLLASDALFARKFDMDADAAVLDALDSHVISDPLLFA